MKGCIVRFLGIALLLNAYQAFGEEGGWLKVCNGTNETIRYAYAEEWDGVFGWTSVGWIRVQPGDCARPNGWYSEKYFYAETLDGDRKWRPQNRRAFCIDPINDFTISEPNCHRPEVEFGRFAPFEGTKKLNLR